MDRVVHHAGDKEPDNTTPSWSNAVQGLWERVTGGEHPLVVTRRESVERSFELWSDGDALFVSATDAIAAAVAVHRYLRVACGQAIHWDTVLPIRLGSLPALERLCDSARVSDFYYLNFCAGSYSTAYWDWADWEREIDWMALHGVTMPLQLVGHEAVLHRVLTQRGLSADDARGFLGGPGYLPFVYMGCVDSFGGALTPEWIDAHAVLGQQILERERSFGMTAVLPAFTGHIPAAIAPDEAVERWWQGIKTHVLPPSSDLFSALASDIVTAQRDMFGTDHLYAADPFIEMIPAETNDATDYPTAVARALIAGLTAGDPEACWVLQSWPFSYQRDYWSPERVAAFLGDVPADRLMLLDLWAEADSQAPRLDGFFDRPWMWNGLLNFGGRGELIAGMADSDRAIERALSAPHPPVGLGLTMEAIHISPVFFEFITDRAWSGGTEPLEGWIREFGQQRYAVADSHAGDVWERLLHSVLAAVPRTIYPERFITAAMLRPTFELLEDRTSIQADIDATLFYEPHVLVGAWSAAHRLGVQHPELAHGPLGADLVQIGTTVLLRLIDFHLADVLRSARARTPPSSETVSAFFNVFDALDALASTRPETTMARWEDAAAAWTSHAADEPLYRDNARRLLTVWNTVENPHLDDYAARPWAGLVSGYYKERWKNWFAQLPDALEVTRRHRAQAKLEAMLEKGSRTFLTDGPERTTPIGHDIIAFSGELINRFTADFVALRPAQSRSERPTSR